MTGKSWEKVAEEAQTYRDASINRFQPITSHLKAQLENLANNLDRSSLPKQVLCSPKELEITETSVEELISALTERKYSAVDVTTAFLRRAVVAQYAVGVAST